MAVTLQVLATGRVSEFQHSESSNLRFRITTIFRWHE